MSKRNWVHEDNETLWSEFEMAFLTAWTDTSKKQNAYDQLMHLTMSGWDVDTYITTFDQLALAAGWDLDLEETITKFCKGLSKGAARHHQGMESSCTNRSGMGKRKI